MIFLDNASTTRIDSEVNELIGKINSDEFFNPSALYKKSMGVKNKIDNAIFNISKLLNAPNQNFIFTSGATECNNTVINGFVSGNKKAEYIFSMGEHPSVYEVAKKLENSGYLVHFVNLTPDGKVDEEHFKSLLNKNTHFISIMHVSNETGAINDIEKLCKLAKQVNPNCIFHSDGVQAVGKIKVDLTKLNVDAYSTSAHKFHGPKGVGFLFIKDFNKFKPYILGGGQQNQKRSGTENVSGILGTELALTKAVNNLKQNFENVLLLRNYLKNAIINSNLKDYKINENTENSPYVFSISFKGLRGEVIQHTLEKYDILIGTGSACSSKKSNNRTLQNMGIQKQYIEGSIRISFSNETTLDEVKFATEKLIYEVKQLEEKVR